MRQLILKDKGLGEDLVVHVGSFMNEHTVLNRLGYTTFNLMQEFEHLPSTYCIPIRDYHIPEDMQEFEEGLFNILRHSVQGDKVFFGCFGGVGRTGIVLACLNKICGVDTNLIYHTRAMLPHALETEAQIEFVKNYNAGNIKLRLEELVINKSIEQSQANKQIIKKIKLYGQKKDISGIIRTIVRVHNTALLTQLVEQGIVQKGAVYDNGKTVADIAFEEKSKPSIRTAKSLQIPRSGIKGFELRNFFLLMSKINEKRKKVDIRNV